MHGMSYRKETEVAILIAKEAGQLLIERLSQKRTIKHKATLSIVTDADHASEAHIIQTLRREFPDHDIMSEETATQLTGAPYCWIIDPLDGTTNYAHNYPSFCVSIALAEQMQPVVGVVYHPMMHELFVAERGRGARLNDAPIRVSSISTLDDALLATGFPYDRRERPDYYLKFYREFMIRTQGLRRAGAAAIDLAYVACGRYDGFWEFGLSPWDVAAAMLLITEAGGTVTDFNGNPARLDDQRILATNGHLHQPMIEVIKNAETHD